MDPELVAQIAQIASVLEVSGHPKPGNVHRTQDFDDMVFEDFLISSILIGSAMKKSAARGLKYKDKPDLLHKIKLGALIREAVLETDKWIANNTNLGIVMLLTPLSAACGMSIEFKDLRKNIDRIMKATTPEDAVNLYDAINIADAGGMGEVENLDVGSDKAIEELIKKDINMYHVLDISSEWDLLSYELTNKMPVTFRLGFPVFKQIKAIHGINKATVQTFLTILAKHPDTLISRKYGYEVAKKVSDNAKAILKEGGILTDIGSPMLEEFDRQLLEDKLNPGTIADLTASSIMAALLDEFGFYKEN